MRARLAAGPHRRAARVLGALGGAFLVSLALLIGAPLLVSPAPPGPAPGELRLYALRPLKPPPPEEAPEPPPAPSPTPELPQLRLDLNPPAVAPPKLDLPRFSFEVNPELASGPALAPPAPAVVSPEPRTAAVETNRFELDQVDRPPVVVGRLRPAYPYQARRRGIEGSVQIRFLVDESGRASQVRILAAEPAGVFEESVLRTVPKWRFKPGVKTGRPVATWVVTTIHFDLVEE